MTRHMKIQTVERYVTGTNEILDSIHDGEPVWIVQGSLGRRPVIAETAALAERRYAEILGHLLEPEEDSLEDEVTPVAV